MRVGLFDSGIGGLTVLNELIKRYPNNDYIYFGDTKNVPYGSKSIEELKELASANVEFLLKHKVSLIVVACGTVSSNCIDYLRDKYDVPIVDIISPTIEYLNNSNYKNVGVIATEATCNSHIFRDKVNKNVYEIKASKLVPLIENNDFSNIENILKEYLDGYINKLDVLVLGCTHYPLLDKYIKKIYHNDILNMASLININNDGNGSVKIYFSKINDLLINNVRSIIDNNVEVIIQEY